MIGFVDWFLYQSLVLLFPCDFLIFSVSLKSGEFDRFPLPPDSFKLCLVEMWNRWLFIVKWLSVRGILLSEPAVEWGAAIGSRPAGRSFYKCFSCRHRMLKTWTITYNPTKTKIKLL